MGYHNGDPNEMEIKWNQGSGLRVQGWLCYERKASQVWALGLKNTALAFGLGCTGLRLGKVFRFRVWGVE